jgi:hypothetical protein
LGKTGAYRIKVNGIGNLLKEVAIDVRIRTRRRMTFKDVIKDVDLKKIVRGWREYTVLKEALNDVVRGIRVLTG